MQSRMKPCASAPCLIALSRFFLYSLAFGNDLLPVSRDDGVNIASEPGDSKELQDLLTWAIEHSDPSELRRQAEAVQLEEGAMDFAKRRLEVQKVIEEMRKQPSEKDLMVEALKIASNSSETVEKRESALTALRYLIEPIDSANDLPGLGGITVLFDIIEAAKEPELVAAAAYALGTAASNNPTFQGSALQFKTGIRGLLQRVESRSTPVSEKGLYAVSSLVRGNQEGQHQFYSSSGVRALRSVLADAPSSSQLRKTLDLITDLTDTHGEVEACLCLAERSEGLQGQAQFADGVLLKLLLQLLQHPDDDVQERSLLALIALAGHPSPRRVMRDAGGRAAVEAAEKRVQQVLRDADAEYREILEHLSVLLGDLDELLSHTDTEPDRTEL